MAPLQMNVHLDKADAYLELADQAKAAADRCRDQYMYLLGLERKYHLAAFRLIREQRGNTTSGDAHGR